MTYIIANPHGCYREFLELLEQIHFGKDDIMFVLGDIVDCGEEPMELLCDLTFRENVWAVAGEHDLLAGRMLSGFEKMLKSGKSPDAEYIADMTSWVSGGGQVTLDAYRALEPDMREGVVEYLTELPGYETLELDGKNYLMVHSGVKGYTPGRELDDYPVGAFSDDGGVREIPGCTVLCGHCPTTEHFEGDGRIYYGDGFIALDCGAARGGRLGCLCLDTGAEYYV